METTKDRILSAVIHYIKENRSPEGITLSEIAKQADIGKSTVYEHFTSKEELIKETHNYLLDYYATMMTRPLTTQSFKEQFIEQMGFIMDVMMDARVMVDAIMNNQEVFAHIGKDIEESVCKIQEKVDLRFRVIFAKGVEEGLFTPSNQKPYQANIIRALIVGLMNQYANKAMKIEKEALYELIYHSVLHFIQA